MAASNAMSGPGDIEHTRQSLSGQSGPEAAPALTLEPPPVAVGEVLAGRYRVLQQIGKGGMGEVFLAEHLDIGRKVAIKVLGARLQHSPDIARRFLQEARTASLVRHPNIVDITDFGHTQTGVPFFVMELLAGQDLKTALRGSARFTWSRARDITLEICATLTAAHQQGVIHRDLKPDNVFLTDKDGKEQIKLLDFGIAKVITPDGGNETTQLGMMVGTPEYMSPEHAQNLPLDARADIYSTGVLLYRMLVGRIPFTGVAVVVLARHIQEAPVPPREAAPDIELSPRQEAVVLRCLAKNPDDRFQSADELARALRAADEADAPPLSPPAAGPAPRASRRVLAWSLGGFTAAAALATFTLAGAGPVAPAPDHPAITAAPIDAPPVLAPNLPPGPPPTPPPDPPTAPPISAPSEPTPPALPSPSVESPQLAPDPAILPTKPRPRPKPAPVSAPRETLSPADLQAGFAAVDAAVRECQRQGAIAGTTVKVEVSIASDGRVTKATAQKPLQGSPLGRCVEKAALTARFPQLTTAQRFTFPFKL